MPYLDFQATEFYIIEKDFITYKIYMTEQTFILF